MVKRTYSAHAFNPRAPTQEGGGFWLLPVLGDGYMNWNDSVSINWTWRWQSGFLSAKCSLRAMSFEVHRARHIHMTCCIAFRCVTRVLIVVKWHLHDYPVQWPENFNLETMATQHKVIKILYNNLIALELG